jgi:hypothetical protein
VPLAVNPMRPGIFLHPADELIASHENQVSDIFVRMSKARLTLGCPVTCKTRRKAKVFEYDWGNDRVVT